MTRYPQRDPFFAHRYTRLLTKSSAPYELGPYATLLCIAVVHQEDAIRYARPVSFFNEQFMQILGMATWVSFNKARNRAVSNEWLHYENKGKRRAGIYWVTVPEKYSDMMGTVNLPIDEGLPAPDAYNDAYKRGYKDGYKDAHKGDDPPASTGSCPNTGRERDAPARSDGSRYKLKRLLQKLLLPHGEKQCREWSDLCLHRLGCKDHLEGLAMVEWLTLSARAKGVTVKYADHVLDQTHRAKKRLEAWRQHGDDSHPLIVLEQEGVI